MIIDDLIFAGGVFATPNPSYYCFPLIDNNYNILFTKIFLFFKPIGVALV